MRDVCVLDGEVGATSTGYGSIPKIKIRFITQRGVKLREDSRTFGV